MINDDNTEAGNPGVDGPYDLIVVGGGIYGILIALESSLRGLRPLLVERAGVAEATTASWLRILHGGLRYLQTADILRFFESVRERRWFMQHFPEYIEPLKCIMPLYREHSHSPWLMRAGLLANDLLSSHRNRGVDERCRIGMGRILNAEDVSDAMPFVEMTGLRAGACWTDAVVTRPEELIRALIDWCTATGVTIVEHTEVTSLQSSDGRVTGIEARSAATGKTSGFSSTVVVNAAGHWAPQLARQFGASMPQPPYVSWAWNVLFNVPMPSAAAAAVSPRQENAQNLFAVPWQGKALVGTGHATIPDGAASDELPASLLENFVADAALALPGLNIGTGTVEKVFLGWMPIDRRDPLRHASRALLIDHADDELRGLFSVWGVKYTTARDVASQVVDSAFPSLKGRAANYASSRPKKSHAT